jgi:molybdopterin-guanine dinucleotide biosynthesis protein A
VLVLVLTLPVDLPADPNRLVAAFFSAASRRAATLLAAVAPLLVVEERPARVVLPLPLPLLPDLTTTRSD